MKLLCYFLWVLCLLFVGCSETKNSDTSTTLFHIDELIDTQINQLGQGGYTLEKLGAVDSTRSQVVFVPSHDKWKNELDIFRQMGIVNKPIYRHGYQIEGHLKDPKSNLKITQYSSNSSPLSLLRIYYQDHVSKLRRIEAIISESNRLYASKKTLTLEFEEVSGKLLLTHYQVAGFQKVALRDTVTFHTQGTINF